MSAKSLVLPNTVFMTTRSFSPTTGTSRPSNGSSVRRDITPSRYSTAGKKKSTLMSPTLPLTKPGIARFSSHVGNGVLEGQPAFPRQSVSQFVRQERVAREPHVDVDVERHPRYAMSTKRERAAHCVGEAKAVEHRRDCRCNLDSTVRHGSGVTPEPAGEGVGRTCVVHGAHAPRQGGLRLQKPCRLRTQGFERPSSFLGGRGLPATVFAVVRHARQDFRLYLHGFNRRGRWRDIMSPSVRGRPWVHSDEYTRDQSSSAARIAAAVSLPTPIAST